MERQIQNPAKHDEPGARLANGCAIVLAEVTNRLVVGNKHAGYASGYDNRTSLILFRHPGVNVLVQCGILYDVTRAQRTIVNCYELR